MTQRLSELSQQMYHRIYRLRQRNHDPLIIAAALNLSAKTVQSVLDRLDELGGKNARSLEDAPVLEESSYSGHDSPVVAVFPKSRYAVMDISGKLSSKNLQLFREELKTAERAGLDYKAIAIRMVDVSVLDDDVVDVLLEFIASFSGRARYVALLDPSPVVDEVIGRLGLEQRVSVFGTERTFEENAFRKSSSTESVKKKRLAREGR